MSFLELAAGPAQHSVEMLHAGLRTRALDRSAEMAQYGRSKAESRGTVLDYVVGDMRRFHTPRPFDLVACMLCSASYLLTEADFLSHLQCVRAALGPEGMYVLELTHPSEMAGESKSNHTWKMRDERGELEIAWGGDPAKSVDGVWMADVRLCYRPFDGGPPIEVRDQAQQRGYTFSEVSRFAVQSGLAVEAALGAFDERIALDDARAQRMILALRRA